MKILYVYKGCSNQKYEQLFANTSVMILQQGQKYHSLLLDGLKKNKAEIECISGLPINRNLIRKWRIPAEEQQVDGIRYHYFSTINFSVIRRLQLLMKSFFYTLTKSRDTVLICDVLDVSSAIGALAAARIKKLRAVGIVTDVPGHLSNSEENPSLFERIRIGLLNKFDGYVFLTEEMNSVVNTKEKPYVVMEGHVDENMRNVENRLENKSEPRIMMYAGSLKRIYGIDRLTEAFSAANIQGWELHIFGDGNFKEDLIDICKMHPNVKYKGIKLNREIVEAELRASLLVNPRPTDEDYVRYSFPSKNMEYMASGTPIITTKLPGMPKEYFPYVYFFEDECVEGMTASLKKVMCLSKEELHEKGKMAKMFVLENKSAVQQAAKIMELIDSVH